MASLLGWKDILRPIRDGYRHLFPTPDTGPTPEERRKQRELDQLKGFTYFDTFEQLETWTEADSGSFERANTPLLRRRKVESKDDLGKSGVLLIHDHAGNYHDYESVQEVGMDEERYACTYLQYVDTFIYFSHKLVCVPPPTWTNALHRNGVLALGTLLIEPQTKDSQRILQHEDSDRRAFPMAKKLAKLATRYGFDGYLINIEKPFPRGDWNPEVLQMFLCDLRTKLGECKRLIWYDALTLSNKVSYQNALNPSNLLFAIGAGNMLTNYCWTETDAKSSAQLAPDLPGSLYFGIDVWAQNTTELTHPRVTYPEKSGGGTNTGVAVAKLAEFGLSAGIFAPAWSFEHFPGHGRAVEQAVWEGTELSRSVDCSCGDCSTRHQPNVEFPIIRSARESAAGSESFFYTDFSRAFGKHGVEEKAIFGGHNMHAQLGAQSNLPRPLTSKDGNRAIDLSYRSRDSAGRTQLLIEARPNSSTMTDENLEHWLPLYKLDMATKSSLQFRASCRNLLPSTTGAVISFYLQSTSGVQLLSIPESNEVQSVMCSVRMDSHLMPNRRLRECGIHLQGSAATKEPVTQLLEVFEICIVPQSALQASQSCTINHIRVEHRGKEGDKHVILSWGYDTVDRFEKVEGMPFSETTGPFSFFNIRFDGLELGRAYALEHPLNQGLVERVQGKNIEIGIIGFGFDGRTLAESKIVLDV